MLSKGFHRAKLGFPRKQWPTNQTGVNRWAHWCPSPRRGTSLNLLFTSDTVSPAIGNKSAFLSLPWLHGTIPGDPRNLNNPEVKTLRGNKYWANLEI